MSETITQSGEFTAGRLAACLEVLTLIDQLAAQMNSEANAATALSLAAQRVCRLAKEYTA